jgi:hypothetical protein
MKRMVAHLAIHWWGAAIGGEHYWGAIKFDYRFDKEPIELKHPMSAKEAKYLNKKDETSKWGRYKAGQPTERFETRDELVACAINTFKSEYPDGILVRGSDCSCSPKEIVYAPDKFKARVDLMNRWAKEHDSLYNNYGVITDEARGDKLEDDWNSLLESMKDDE